MRHYNERKKRLQMQNRILKNNFDFYLILLNLKKISMNYYVL